MSKRGRKPSKMDTKVKLERSRQSARECRARKKLRYQTVEYHVTTRENSVYALREELEQCKKWAKELDSGKVSENLRKWLTNSSIKIESSAKKNKVVVKEEAEEGAEAGAMAAESEGVKEYQQVPNVAGCSNAMQE